MESQVEVKDDDLITYVRNILQFRIMPINYTGLRDLIKQAPPHLKAFADAKYKDEKFLNFLLSHSDIFNVSSDGTVALVDSVEYVFPHGVDTVDAIAGISDDSYFGDREEYISDSDEDSHTSVSSSDVLMFQKDQPKSDTVPLKQFFLSKLKDVTDSSRNGMRECECDTTSSSESSNDFVSSASESGGSTSGGSNSNSSFESCDERRNNSQKSHHSTSCPEKTSGSSSYSSCSES